MTFVRVDQKCHRTTSFSKIFGGLSLAIAILSGALAQDRKEFFGNSYALVIGIDSYGHAKWPKLTYAVKDAKGFASFLRAQGFTVTELYEEQATRTAIISAIEDQLVPKLTENDRVVLFFAGHGATRPVGDSDRGYLVPADGTDSYGSLIAVTQLHDLSSIMGKARHQLFILDSCFGGLAAMRTSRTLTTIDPRTPDYVYEITRRRARQLLTAGGANQQVLDGGPDGHSYFTGQLLGALQDGRADANGDGYITFSELSAYIQVAASRYNQTPGIAVFGGHEQGDFFFLNSVYRSDLRTKTDGRPALQSKILDVYEPLRAGKAAMLKKNYVDARREFLQAAELGNAEAMAFLGRLYLEGWGGAQEEKTAIEWYRKSAERGYLLAMQSLVNIYKKPGPTWNPDEARRWEAARQEAQRLEATLNIVDPSGEVGRREPALPAAASVAPPAAPRGLTVR